MTQYDEMLTELVDKWRAEGTVIREGASDDEIRTFHQRFNVELPCDVIAYLKRVDGMASHEVPKT